MASIDLKKTFREHYSAGKDPALLDVPERRFLMVDGAGDPNTNPAYSAAIEALYPIAYGLRAAIKRETGDAYTVMPLEGLWWVPDMRDFSIECKSNWLWTAMIVQPEVATPALAAAVISDVTGKKDLAAEHLVRLEGYHEGLAAQVLHVGPYADEGPTIRALHEFIEREGFQRTGKHHEIYLSDPRRSDPAKLRTIIRQPVTR